MLTIGIFLCLLAFALGESPLVFWHAFSHTFFTQFGLGYALFYATPLIFTGLSFALCQQAGFFNIGAEGQLSSAALFVLLGSTLTPAAATSSPFLAISYMVILAMVGGAFLGLLGAALRIYFRVHEVVATILLNFIALDALNYFVLGPLKSPTSQAAASRDIPALFQLPLLSEVFSSFGFSLFSRTPANSALFFAIAAAIALHLYLYKSVAGLSLRACGANARVSHYAGISGSRICFWAFALGGAAAGGVALTDVCGYAHKVYEGFSPGYGYSGIAVSLLARHRPLGIIASGFFLGGIHNASRELEFMSDRLTSDTSLCLEGVLLVCMSMDIPSLTWRLWQTLQRTREYIKTWIS